MRYYNHGRLNKIYEAIDSDDTELYWQDRTAWNHKHGYYMNGGSKRRWNR